MLNRGWVFMDIMGWGSGFCFWKKVEGDFFRGFFLV